MKRSRGRNRRQGNPANRNYESNGPDVKVRGHASTINEKYLSLARDALTAGDPVNAENYFQHAEHYFRIMSANQPAKNEETAGADAAETDAADGNVEPLILGQGDEEGGKDETASSGKGRRRGHLRRRPKDEAAEAQPETEAQPEAEAQPEPETASDDAPAQTDPTTEAEASTA